MEIIAIVLPLILTILQIICNILDLKKKRKSLNENQGINYNDACVNNSFNQSYHYKILNSTIKNEKNIIVNNHSSIETDTSSGIIFLFILSLIFIFCWSIVSPNSLFIFIFLLSFFYICQNWTYLKKHTNKTTKIKIITMFCVILLTIFLFHLNPFAPNFYNAEFWRDFMNNNQNKINASTLYNNWYSLLYSLFRSIGITCFISSLFISIRNYFFNKFLTTEYDSNSIPVIFLACISIIFSSGIFYKFLFLNAA